MASARRVRLATSYGSLTFQSVTYASEFSSVSGADCPLGNYILITSGGRCCDVYPTGLTCAFIAPCGRQRRYELSRFLKLCCPRANDLGYGAPVTLSGPLTSTLEYLQPTSVRICVCTVPLPQLYSYS